jgi:hypothetical protein
VLLCEFYRVWRRCNCTYEFRKVVSCRGAILRLFPMSTSGDTPRKYAVKLHHISEALVASGYTTLDDQAKALGIHRSTAWTIIKTKHKLGRLSTKTTKRILANPATPASVRAIVQRYLAERSDIVEDLPRQSRLMSSYHFTDRQRISVTGPSGTQRSRKDQTKSMR